MYEGRWEIFECVKVMEAGKTQELQGEVAAFWEKWGMALLPSFV